MILVDTNILLRAVHPQHSHHSLAGNALAKLRLRNEALCVAPQNLVEFWAVATRPREENGLGMTARQAATELDDVKDFLPLAALYTRSSGEMAAHDRHKFGNFLSGCG